LVQTPRDESQPPLVVAHSLRSSHDVPLPVYPALHSHVYDASVSVHSASEWHECVSVHSATVKRYTSDGSLYSPTPRPLEPATRRLTLTGASRPETVAETDVVRNERRAEATSTVVAYAKAPPFLEISTSHDVTASPPSSPGVHDTERSYPDPMAVTADGALGCVYATSDEDEGVYASNPLDTLMRKAKELPGALPVTVAEREPSSAMVTLPGATSSMSPPSTERCTVYDTVAAPPVEVAGVQDTTKSSPTAYEMLGATPSRVGVDSTTSMA